MDYLTLTEETLDDIVTKVDQFKAHKGDELIVYFKELMVNAQNLNCSLVVFKARGEWQHIFISNEYNVPFVMKQLESRLND